MTEKIETAAATDESAEENIIKVLFVDDEKPVLISLRRLFRKMDWRIYTAESGAEGLAIIAEQSIDLVVSDMRMPQMNGAEFLEQVAERSPSTVRVLLTGYSEIDSTIAAINKGKIFSYCTKPWDNDELKAVLSRAVYSRQLELERDQLLLVTKQQNEALQTMNASLESKVDARTDVIRKAAQAVKNLNKKLNDSYKSSVEVFSNLIDMGRKSTSGRSKRVAEISRILATELHLPEAEIEQVYYAALLANVGKLSLPAGIARMKESDMNPNQKNIYRKHPLVADAVLMSVEALKPAANYIRHQAEREDGKGYPSKLAGGDIPTGAQCIHIVTYYDELLNDDSLDEPLTNEEITKALEKTIGRRFAKPLVDRFIQLINESRFSIEQNEERRLNVAQLEPEMILTRDVVAENGVLLLSAGAILNTANIKRLAGYEEELENELPVHVFRSAEEDEEDPQHAKAS